jgi:hypothetical protein
MKGFCNLGIITMGYVFDKPWCRSWELGPKFMPFHSFTFSSENSKLIMTHSRKGNFIILSNVYRCAVSKLGVLYLMFWINVQ